MLSNTISKLPPLPMPQIIEELTADNARLRRQALILSYIPDLVLAIGLDGKIKFCNTQLARVLKHDADDLNGAGIKDIVVPESRGAIRRMIQDLVAVEQIVTDRGEGTDSGSDSNGGQTVSDSTNTEGMAFQSSVHPFNVSEVNVNGQDKLGDGDNVSDSSGDPSSTKKDGRKSSKQVSFGKASPTQSSDEPPRKKNKTSNVAGMDVDDVMGESVTANNASAKLSSLIHKGDEDKKPAAKDFEQPLIHRKHALAARAPAQKQDSRSSSSTESDAGQRPGVNSSEDSGYMDSISNGSSDETGEDSSDSFWKEGMLLMRCSVVLFDSLDFTGLQLLSSSPTGKRARPLAPGCIVRLICKDLTTIWCEVTASIRTRTRNDEDSELGIIDLNPKSVAKLTEDEMEEEEKEVLICFRPILKGEKVEEDLRFHNVSESSNTNESNKSSFGSENKEVSDEPDSSKTKKHKCSSSDDTVAGKN